MKVVMTLTITEMKGGKWSSNNVAVVVIPTALAFAIASSLAGIAKHQFGIKIAPSFPTHTWVNRMMADPEKLLLLSDGMSDDSTRTASIQMRPVNNKMKV